MPFTAHPQQLKLLRQAVDDYCRDCGIVDADERLYVAELASSLFDLGAITIVDLRKGLDDAMGGPTTTAAEKPAALVERKRPKLSRSV